MKFAKSLVLLAFYFLVGCVSNTSKVIEATDPLSLEFKKKISGKTFVTVNIGDIAAPIFRHLDTASFNSGKEFTVTENGGITLNDREYFSPFSKVQGLNYYFKEAISESSALYHITYLKDGTIQEATDIGNKTIELETEEDGRLTILLKGSDGEHKPFATEKMVSPDTESLDNPQSPINS
ncbi:MAG: hypothetical protein ACRCV0_00965 [Brevinema sp.]